LIGTELLGMRLEDALEKLRCAVEPRPEILYSAAPKGERAQGVMRVVRVRPGQLTVCTFLDGQLQHAL